MKIAGCLGALACVVLCLALLSSFNLNTLPLAIYSAEAGAGADAVKAEAEPEVVAESPKKKRIGPPPLVHTEFYELCATCHKPDGRGGRSYGGYAANLHETELEKEGLIYFMKYGRPDKGMPAFEGIIGKRVMNAIANYIIDNFKGKPLAEGMEEHSRGAIDD